MRLILTTVSIVLTTTLIALRLAGVGSDVQSDAAAAVAATVAQAMKARPSQQSLQQLTPPLAAHGRMVILKSDRRGYFQAQADVDGRRLAFLVDTGASAIVLRESSAAQLGLRPLPRDYTIKVATANGVTKGAPVTLRMVDIDGVVVRNVAAIVQPDHALPVNLLGMTYLSRVRWSHDRGRLVIEQ